MFDWFYAEVSCPICGNRVKDFQTKDLDSLLDRYQPGDHVHDDRLKKINVYGECIHRKELEKIEEGMVFIQNFGVWIEINIPVVDGEIARDQNTWEMFPLKEIDFGSLSFIPDDMTNEEVVLSIVRYNDARKRDINVTEALKKARGE